MDILDHRKVEEIFQQAADLPPEQRTSFLDAACNDSAVREEVDSLLAHLGRSRIGSLQAVDLMDKTDAELVDERVGPYRLLELIGEGGFGAVYMAEQERPVRRRVAVKIPKLGMDTRQVVARFEAERQALAMMEHPNIAKVFDAGATEAGRPYFAMELVRGVPIIEHCNENRSTTKERLELFIHVCRGVQHAHQKGIIHRDLKPSNVLVTLHDGVPVPKIIDFGIAKATDQPLTEKTLFTRFRQFVGTPEYVSPEQAGMSGIDVDTRSDIYSLGVLLYELLTGMTPFDSQVFRSATYPEIQRIICEQEPITPSRRLSTLGVNLTQIAAARRTEPHVLRRLLRGDLDWIVIKALEKDRTRRYETAAAMADDVQRHLEHEPVSAGPPGAIYRLRKLAARHRAAFGFVAVMLGVVLAFGVWMSFLYTEANELRLRAECERSVAEANLTRAQEAEEQAKREAETAAEVAQILAGLFEIADPFKTNRGSATARAILDEGAAKIRDQLQERPEAQAALMDTIGGVYTNLGLFDKAVPLLKEALELRRNSLGDTHPDTIASMNSLGEALMYDHRFSEAEPLLREAIKAGRSALGIDHLATIDAVAHLSWMLQSAGRWREAEPLCRQALTVYRRELGNDHPRTISAINALSWLLCCLTHFGEGETLAREGLENSLRAFGEESAYTAESMNALGVLLLHQRKVDQAAPLIRQAEVIRGRLLGRQHPDTLESMENVAGVLVQQGAPAEAEVRYREALAEYRQLHGPDHRRVFRSMCRVGGAMVVQGRYAEAQPLLEEGLAGLRRLAGEDHPETVNCLRNLAGALWRQGKLGERAEAFHEAYALHRSMFGTKDPETIASMVFAAHVLHDQRQWVAAEARLNDTLAVARAESASLPCADCLIGILTSLLGDCLAQQGHQDEAEPLLLAGYSTLAETFGRHERQTLEAFSRVVRFYHYLGQPERAETWRAKALLENVE